MPMTHRKKPVEIEAHQLTGDNAHDHGVYQWVERNTQGSFDPEADEVPASGVSIDPATGFMLIATLEGVMKAKPGWWIIQGVAGEFYPCDPAIFRATYERIAEVDVNWDAAPLNDKGIHHLLKLVGEDRSEGLIGTWTSAQKLAVIRWASAEHLIASDNDVVREQRPAVMDA